MSAQSRILIVEDERNLALGIAENLRAEAHAVECVDDGERAVERILQAVPDLVLLDVMLPGIDGFEVCRRVRSAGCNVPVLFLTAKGGVDDRVQGLEAGGDDYLAKPFQLRELLARVTAILRRQRWYGEVPGAERVLRFGGNEFDFRSFAGRSFDGREQVLTQREAMILKALAERAGEVISREDVLEKVWGYDVYPSTRTIDNFILRLRKRFERDPEQPRHFHTVRGVGYRFTSEPA
ncbi:MAG: response regulator transcription factor [Planctomycetota bacterium]|nr:MAG: response regulator transcription factor [Planctomycetota bacterium]